MQTLKRAESIERTGEDKDVKFRIAKRISTFTNPPILCIPLFLLICIILSCNGSPFASGFSFDWNLFILDELISLVFTSLLPMAIIIHWAKKLNTDSDISNREDRFVPLIVGTVSYFIGFVISIFANTPKFLTLLLLCYTTNTFIVMLITSKWKISIHTTGLSGPVAALIMLIGPYGALFGLMYPILIWSRVLLKKHTMAQAISGGFLGFILTVVETYLFMTLFGISIPNLVSLGESLWIIGGIVACPVVLGLLGLLNKMNVDRLYTRKLFHLLAFLGFAFFYFYAPYSAFITLILCGTVSVLITIYAGEGYIWFKALDSSNKENTNNKNENTRFNGRLSLLISLTCSVVWIIFALFLFTRETAIITSLCLAFAGAIAEPISIKLANHKFSMKSLVQNQSNKSIEASVAVLITTMVIILLFTQNTFISIAAGLAVCFIETFIPNEIENLITPIVVAILLKFLLHI